jgi:hypothetical protein
MPTKVRSASWEHIVARQLLLGLRERLTIAARLGSSVEVVNEALVHLQETCERCLTLTRPNADEPRVVATIEDREALRRVAWRREPEHRARHRWT